MGAVPVDQRAPTGPLAPGAKLGRYEILAKLAAGGMAIVYVGRVQGVAGFERLVAIKVLHANLAHEEEFIGMFLDEARLAASIRHPNVVPTIDISDSEEAGYFIVMEYIEGDHLGAVLASAHKLTERLPLQITLRVIADALGGLGAAHDLCDETGKSLQLVHRDVSPHNIMVGRDGVVRLTDFGVAKAADRLTHTRDGQVKGKLAYMAPEQAANGKTDSRSDLFSMGVILWECLTGQRLFRAENTAATLHKLLHEEIPLVSTIDPQLAPLDAILGKALARDPAQRFQTAEEFAQAVEEVAPLFGGLSSLRGVARVVKQYAATKLKRDKKLIDDALRALRPADAPALAPELESEITSPSVTEISVPGEALSASKVSGVFSHDTLPGNKRMNVRLRDDPRNSAMRPLPADLAAEQALAPSADQLGDRAQDGGSSRGRLMLSLGGLLLLAAAIWAAARPAHENVRVREIDAAQPAPVQPPERAAIAPTAANDGVAPQAEVHIATTPASDTSHVRPTPVSAERSVRRVAAKHPDASVIRRPAVSNEPVADKQRARKERTDKEPVPARPTRDKPRTGATSATPVMDVIPNPYHN